MLRNETRGGLWQRCFVEKVDERLLWLFFLFFGRRLLVLIESDLRRFDLKEGRMLLFALSLAVLTIIVFVRIRVAIL